MKKMNLAAYCRKFATMTAKEMQDELVGYDSHNTEIIDSLMNIYTEARAAEIKTKIEKTFWWLHFEEDSHTYTDISTGKELTSCTTYCKQFFEAFDAEAKAEEIAARSGRKKAMILADWENSKIEAGLYGTKIHKYAEQGKEMPFPSTDDERAVWTAFNILCTEFKYIGSEIIVGNSELGVAGTIDLLMMDKKGNLQIFDWKTSKEIFSKSYSNMKKPLEKFPCNNYNKYSLQMNIYAKLLEAAIGIKTFANSIIHIKDGVWTTHHTDSNVTPFK